MQMAVPKGRANYEPNSLAQAGEDGGPREDPKGGFRTAPIAVEGEKVRLRAETFADHYSQARLFFRSQTEIEQAHLASAIVFELSKVSLPHVRERILANLQNVDQTLAQRVADGLNLPLPKASEPAVPPIDLDASARASHRRQISRDVEGAQGRHPGRRRLRWRGRRCGQGGGRRRWRVGLHRRAQDRRRQAEGRQDPGRRRSTGRQSVGPVRRRRHRPVRGRLRAVAEGRRRGRFRQGRLRPSEGGRRTPPRPSRFWTRRASRRTRA